MGQITLLGEWPGPVCDTNATSQLPSMRALGAPVSTSTNAATPTAAVPGSTNQTATAVVAAAGAASGTTTNAPAAAGSKGRTIVPGMVLGITVEEDPTLDQRLTVSPTGTIEFSPLGKMQVDGKSVDDLLKQIKTRLERDYFQTANVNIVIESTPGGPGAVPGAAGVIYVLGAIGHPGPLLLPREEKFTVMKAILAAGGCGQFGNCSKVQLVRYDQTGKKYRTVINVAHIMDGFFEEDVFVQNGDWLIVPEKIFSF